MPSLPPSKGPRDLATAVSDSTSFAIAERNADDFHRRKVAESTATVQPRTERPRRAELSCVSAGGQNKLADGGANLSKFCNEQEEKLASR